MRSNVRFTPESGQAQKEETWRSGTANIQGLSVRDVRQNIPHQLPAGGTFQVRSAALCIQPKTFCLPFRKFPVTSIFRNFWKREQPVISDGKFAFHLILLLEFSNYGLLFGCSTISGFSGEFHQFVPPHVNAMVYVTRNLVVLKAMILEDLRRHRGRVVSALDLKSGGRGL